MRNSAAALLVLFVTIPSAEAAPRTIEVDSHLVGCTDAGEQRCMRIRDGADQPWQIFRGQIEGFTYEAGYRYRLKVDEEAVANPPAEASAARTILVEMVRKVAVEPPADPFAGKTWRLYELQLRASAETQRPTSMITLAIDTPAERAAGKGGCNSWFATAKVRGLALELTGMGATMMACPPPAMDEERAFLEAIGRTQGYGVEDDSLTLALSDGGIMRFRELID